VASFLKGLKKEHKKKKKSSERHGEQNGSDEPHTKSQKEDPESFELSRREKVHKEKKRKKHERSEMATSSTDERPSKRRARTKTEESASSLAVSKPSSSSSASPFSFPIRYICAPMVGASELAFRLLCRKYGCQLAYTPMMSAHKFAYDADYRDKEFSTCPADRPLVCHFSANEPADFAAACVQASTYCDAIDLNLGCPQRTAFLGHFGSYLLDPSDRTLLCEIIKAGAAAVSIPIFCKIRLLATLKDTVELCQQLRDAGVSLIAIHGRRRATWERKGAGARDGPALLDQVAAIKKEIPEIPIITNGNTITYQHVVDNLNSTAADGLMSAEGLLDNPALFLPQLGSREESGKQVTIPNPLGGRNNKVDGNSDADKKRRKLEKKLRAIERIERTVESKGESVLTDEERQKLSTRTLIQESLSKLEANSNNASSGETLENDAAAAASMTDVVSLGSLYTSSDDKFQLALEYLDLATTYPVTIRTVIFHTRRMIKDTLIKYQMLEECLACENLPQVYEIFLKIKGYRDFPITFSFDQDKAKELKAIRERKAREEGRRKDYEARMMRKAKREGKKDLMVSLVEFVC
jgi:tRNA-dihydrouridine synthase 1